MKTRFKVVFLLVFSVLFLTLSGCDLFMGDDGDVTLTITVADSYVEYCSSDISAVVDGIKSDWTFNEECKVNEGNYDIQYVLSYHAYEWNTNASAYRWHYYFNSNNEVRWVYSYEEDFATVMGEFFSSDYAAVCSETLSIRAEEGELFTDGEDRDYTLSLAWDPTETDVTYRGISLDKTVTIEGDSRVLTFTDGYMTFTVTVPDAPVAPGGNLTSINGEVR